MVNTRQTVFEESVEPPHNISSSTSRINPNSEDQDQLPLSIEEQLQQAQEVVANLKRIQNERNEVNRDLEAQIQPRFTPESPQKGKDIKIEDIETFNNRFSIQKRYEWLINLDLAFLAAPYRFSSGKAKVLGGLAYVDHASRTKWVEHLLEKTQEQSEIYSNSWDYFKEWTLTLIRNAANFKADIRNQIEAAHQLYGQHPYDFDTYLHSQEEHLPRESEENRSLTFFSKLLPELRLEIQRHVRPLPVRREEMVEIAALYWNLLPSKSTSKPRHFTTKSDSPHKNFRSPSKEPQKLTESDYMPKTHKRRQIHCFNCGSPDHIRPNCPQSAQAQRIISMRSKSKNLKGSK
jgi:hypothetical protein